MTGQTTRTRHRRRAVLAVTAAAALVITPAATQLTPARAAATPAAPWSANLLKGAQGNFDSGKGGWVGLANTSVWRQPLIKYAGKASLSLTNTGTSLGLTMAQSGDSPATFTPAVPGQRYRGYFYMRSMARVASVAPALAFYDASGASIQSVVGMYLHDGRTSWERSADIAAVAPPGAAYVALRAAIQGGLTGALPGESHLIDSAYLGTATVSQTKVVGPLRTSGNKIYDATGRVITFRGFSRAGLEGQVRDDGTNISLPTDDEIAHARGWGANVIRLPLGEQKWLPNTCYYDNQYVSKVDDAVRLVTSRGMVALLDLHFNQIKSCGRAGQNPMADAPNSLTFWQQVAGRYKTNPLVAFDLYNEPHDISEAVWRNGGTTTYKGQTFKAAGMQQMYDVVRQAGASNLVIATGVSWGNNPPSTGLNGYNIAYGIHSYTCPQKPPPDCGHPDSYSYNGTIFLKKWVSFAKNKPVFVTEFGWPNPNDDRYIQSLINYAEANKIGWVIFTWGNETVGRFDLVAGTGYGTVTNYQPAPVAVPALIAMPA